MRLEIAPKSSNTPAEPWSTHTYDDTYKLLEETITNPDGSMSVTSYTYDAVGNRLTKPDNGFTTIYQYNENNQLVREGDITYSYDDNGNPKEKTSAEETIEYFYDSENHLTRVETTRFGVTIVVEYEYDAEGNRVRKIIDDTIVINYLVDSNRDYAQVLEEWDQNGTLLVRYVYGHDLISQTRGGATTYYHYDGLGSTRALTVSSEAMTDTYTYDAFGNLLDKTGTTTNDYLYTGEFFDTNIGFYYLRARYMNPEIGRFVTMDAFAGRNRDPYSLHKYLYANANPVTYVDPSGHIVDLPSTTVATGERATWDRYQLQGGAMLFFRSKILVSLVLAGYIGGVAAAALPHNALPDAMEARAYHNASTLDRIQTEIQIELELEDDSSGIRFYRGLSKIDLQEFYWYWLIFANGLRGPNPEYLGKGRKWSVGEIRSVLTKILHPKKFIGVASEHAGGGSSLERTPFVSVTTKEEIAIWFAHAGTEDDPTGGPSRHVLRVKTKRARENPQNKWKEYHYDGGVLKSGQAEWLVPLVIVRKAETLGEPYLVPAPKKSPWE